MPRLVDQFGDISEVSERGPLTERINQERLDASVKLVHALETIMAPVADKLPEIGKALAQAKRMMADASNEGMLSKLAGKMTPDVVKPLTDINRAIGFVVAISQGLVQLAQLHTGLGSVPKSMTNEPMSALVDKTELYKRVKSAITPDGVLGFLRGIPLADDGKIIREIMTLTHGDYVEISRAVKSLTDARKSVGKVAKGLKRDTQEINVKTKIDDRSSERGGQNEKTAKIDKGSNEAVIEPKGTEQFTRNSAKPFPAARTDAQTKDSDDKTVKMDRPKGGDRFTRDFAKPFPAAKAPKDDVKAPTPAKKSGANGSRLVTDPPGLRGKFVALDGDPIKSGLLVKSKHQRSQDPSKWEPPGNEWYIDYDKLIGILRG